MPHTRRVLGEEHMPEDPGVEWAHACTGSCSCSSPTDRLGRLYGNEVRNDGLEEILKGLRHNATLTTLKGVDCLYISMAICNQRHGRVSVLLTPTALNIVALHTSGRPCSGTGWPQREA